MKLWAWTILGATTLLACGNAGSEQGTTTSSTTGSGGSGGAGGSATTATTATGSGTTSSGAVGSGGGAATGHLTVQVAPDPTLPDQIVAAIEGATVSVHMTMYILDDDKIVAALLDRKQAGLDVRVVLNQTFPTGTVQTNPATFTKLQGAGIGVVWRNGPPGAHAGAYTHEKAFVLDGKRAFIMTMNLDHSAPLYNREYLVIDDTPADVAETDAIFLADYTGTADTSGAPLVVSPGPPGNSRAALVALIDAATTTLDVEGEEFSDNTAGGVTAAIAAAAHRGVATRVVVANDTFSTAETTAIATVKAGGAKVVMSGGTSGKATAANPYIHAKAIVIDCAGTTCARGYLGSENFTGNSLGDNRELGLILDDATELSKVEAAITTDFAKGTAQ